MLVFLLQRFPAPFWTLQREDLRNKGTDPEDTVEMMLTSTLPLAGQRFQEKVEERAEFPMLSGSSGATASGAPWSVPSTAACAQDRHS